MKILFIENRSMTWLWAAIAKKLVLDGHEVHWLVLNRFFVPSVGHAHLIDFSSYRSNSRNFRASKYDSIAKGDRGILHFGMKGDYYCHFDSKIKEILMKVSPEVVFGEATQFYELLAVESAATLNIPYLSPCASRYPVGRMSFFIGSTMKEFGGSGVNLSDSDAGIMISNIEQRKILPSYMVKPPKVAFRKYCMRIFSHLVLIASWIGGERFITPSPLCKLILELKRFFVRFNWERKACFSLPAYLTDSNWVLFPLQMQPESNIDVWGLPWNNQYEIIEKAARALADINSYLVVKPNPKSKYELNSSFFNLLMRHKNIIFMSHKVQMAPLFKMAPLVMTVTGTVLLESIFSGKPIACLGAHSMSRYPGVTSINSPESVANALVGVNDGSIKGADSNQAVKLIKYLYYNSYPAQIWDPIARPDLANSKEIESLYLAFTDILSKIPNSDTSFNNCHFGKD